MDAAGTAVMPPKKTPKPKAKMGRPKAPKPLRSLTVFRGTDDYGAWLDAVMRADRVNTRVLLMRRALSHYAKAIGVKDEAPDR